MREFLTSKVTEFIHSAIFFFLFSFLWSWGDQFAPRFCRFLWWSSSQVSSEKLLSPRFSLLHLGFSLPHITWKNLGHHWRWRKVAILPTHSLLLLRWEKSTSWSRPNEPNEMKKRPKQRENRPFVFQTCLRHSKRSISQHFPNAIVEWQQRWRGAPAFQASPPAWFSLSAIQLIICPASVRKFLAARRQGQMSLSYPNWCSFQALWQNSDPIQQSYPRSDLQGKKSPSRVEMK